MSRLALDTSFLISFADPGRPHHGTAVQYFRHCLTVGIEMCVSTLAAGEFEVGQPFSDLPLQNFLILPYNLAHAQRAGRFVAALRSGQIQRAPGNRRPVVINDLGILGQADAEGIGAILTEDDDTLSRMANQLRAAGLSAVATIVLKDGFQPGLLAQFCS